MVTGSPGRSLPRVVIAAPASGHGKTTVAIGLMAALRGRGLVVAPAKVGPDYIDPGYHTLATGRPGRNLDPFLVGPELVTPLLWHAADTPEPADVAVIEGVMGLYDGRLGTAGFASTAHVAALTGSPVLLVIDVRHASRSIGAVVHGMATYPPGPTLPAAPRIAGVILNQVGSPRHATEAAAAIEPTGIPVLGVLARETRIVAPSRHLGLVPAAERPEAARTLRRLGAIVAEHVDLDAVAAVAATAPDLTGAPWDPVEAVAASAVGESADRPVVAIAGGRAFTFRYPETDELLAAAGCEPVTFDPLTDPTLPAGSRGLYLGGGFPQVYAAELAGNAALREQVRREVAAGMPVVAECAGMLYLADRVDGAPMVGVLPAAAAMTSRLTMGYREASAPADTLLARAGETVRGHEFHRTALDRGAPRPAWRIGQAGQGWSLTPADAGPPTVHASYLHLHWAGFPQAARRFADAVRGYRPERRPPATTAPAATPNAEPHDPVDLHHHGDRDLVPGTVDLAVNVRGVAPDWLRAAIQRDGDWSAYPDSSDAVAALASRHGLPADMVLPTSGAAEAFTLVARALRPAYPLIVHPQFTEPEAALAVAGHQPVRHLLARAAGFRLDPAAVDPRADLIVVGNPTNPTSVLHPAATLRSLRAPGRVLVVDEAFMDLVPGEPETLIGPNMPGLLVIRSLTKSWGVAGLRAGYVVGDPALVSLLAAQQPPWSVSTPALRVIEAVSSPAGVAHAAALARATATDRADLVARLDALGLPSVAPAYGPFVLVDSAPLARGSVRSALAERGFAVRRCETFPGLSATWIRVAVRDPATHLAFAAALADLRGMPGAAPGSQPARDPGYPPRPATPTDRRTGEGARPC